MMNKTLNEAIRELDASLVRTLWATCGTEEISLYNWLINLRQQLDNFVFEASIEFN